MNGKKALRTELKLRRINMEVSYKASADRSICEKVTASLLYKDADSLLIYVSSDIEVDTKDIIQFSLEKGKAVFVPRCVGGTNEMHFYRIRSFDDLECGCFGILEPKEYCEKYTGSNNALCITPALAYDREGFRLGFGKGFYDRFLSGFNGRKFGICYDGFILDNVFRDSFDVPVDMIITENREIITDDEREE